MIQVAGLGKAFGGAVVLEGVDLSVRSGEAVALLGANGAGKTTLLRIVATLVRPSKGRVAVAGHDCVREAERVRARVAMVAHGSYVYEDLTAAENLRFWAGLSGVDAPRDRIAAALTAVELDRFADERARTFSVGMRRRLSLARIFLTGPAVLLLDEPFAGLDQRAGKWLEGYLQQFKTGGGAVLMTTHTFSRGLSVMNRAAILAGGRIALDTTLDGLGADDIRSLYDLYAEEGA